MFLNLNAGDLKLWKVNIFNDNKEKILKLVLKNEDKEGMTIIRGIVSDYWEEQPSNDFTHVIIDSPMLVLRREKQKESEKVENLTKELNELRIKAHGK